jgi:hypothetical protein
MGMQNESGWRRWALTLLVPAFQSTFRAIKINFGHRDLLSLKEEAAASIVGFLRKTY